MMKLYDDAVPYVSFRILLHIFTDTVEDHHRNHVFIEQEAVFRNPTKRLFF